MKFEMDEVEVASFNAFKDEQLLKNRTEGEYEFHFVPTGIAMAVIVKNRLTGEEKNISNFDNW